MCSSMLSAHMIHINLKDNSPYVYKAQTHIITIIIISAYK